MKLNVEQQSILIMLLGFLLMWLFHYLIPDYCGIFGIAGMIIGLTYSMYQKQIKP